jgi:hypothetical protein
MACKIINTFRISTDKNSFKNVILITNFLHSSRGIVRAFEWRWARTKKHEIHRNEASGWNGSYFAGRMIYESTIQLRDTNHVFRIIASEEIGELSSDSDTERQSWVSSTPCLYAWGPWFDSRRWGRISWDVFMIFPSLSRQILGR